MNQQPVSKSVNRCLVLWLAGVLLLPSLALLLIRTPDAAFVIALIVTPALSLMGGILLGLRLGRSASGKLMLTMLTALALLICAETLLSLSCSFVGVRVRIDI